MFVELAAVVAIQLSSVRSESMANPCKILVVGAGIAGLAFAAALRHDAAEFDTRIDLVDLAPQWRPVGSGIAIGFNGVLALNKVGVGAAVQDRGITLNKVALLDAHGSVLNSFGFGAISDVYGCSTVGIHRASLHDALAGSLTESPRLGVTVTDLNERDESVVAQFSDGTDGEYDLVVGADGLGSRVRQLVFGPAGRRYAGYSAVRIVVDRRTPADGMCELWGSGRRMGILPIGPDLLYSYSTFLSAPGAARDAAAGMGLVQELFSDFSGPARQIVESQPDDESVHCGDIDEVILPRWHTRRIVLIGDAAHAMCPDLGQGGSMAIEDAVTLARTLATAPAVPDALVDYQSKRYRRVTDIQRKSRQYGWLVHRQTVPARAVRRAAVKALAPKHLARTAVASLINPVA